METKNSEYRECDNCGDIFNIEELNEVGNHWLCSLCLAELESDLGI